MTYETVGCILYFLQNNKFYIVGNNSTNPATGITNYKYSGEITILEKIYNKEVREIGQRAFFGCCNITRVTILAKLTAIHYEAFDQCAKLNYINIPQTVTFIGKYALSVAELYYDDFYETEYYLVSDEPFQVEFCKGRTKTLYLGQHAISHRKNIKIIYPSSIEPLYSPYGHFADVNSATICAYKLFKFCNKFDTNYMSQCPTPIFGKIGAGQTCKRKVRNNITLISLMPFV